MDDLEMLYYEQELKDIKEYCKRSGNVLSYQCQNYYLYDNRIYDEEMNIVIRYPENGFLDLFEYYEYLEENT